MQRYHDDEDVGDVESGSPGSVSAAGERRMSAHLGRVALVELVHDAVERLHLVVQSPLLLVHERLHVDGGPLQLVVLQDDLVLAALRRDRDGQVLRTYRHRNRVSATPLMPVSWHF